MANLSTYFTLCSSVSIVNFDAGWACCHFACLSRGVLKKSYIGKFAKSTRKQPPWSFFMLKLQVIGFLNGCNGVRTHNHLVGDRTLNHLAN